MRNMQRLVSQQATQWIIHQREIIAAFRAGQLEKVMRSNTVWLCTSCYYCTVRCPSGIKFTDIMYELKRLGVEFGLVQEGAIAPVMSKTFVEMVDKYGRLPETALVMNVLLKTNPLGLLKMMPHGLRLFLRGRMPLFPHRISGVSDLKKCSEAMTDALVSDLHPSSGTGRGGVALDSRMEFSYYPGCALEGMNKAYDTSTRLVSKRARD